MTCPWGDEVAGNEGVEEDALAAEDHEAHEPAWFGHLQEGEEVHALVVGLFEERLDPAIVSLHTADTMEVSQHTGNHTRNCGHGF